MTPSEDRELIFEISVICRYFDILHQTLAPHPRPKPQKRRAKRSRKPLNNQTRFYHCDFTPQ